MDVNTEPSQSEQIIWDDPTAREERARLVSNLQWPNSPSQCTEQGHGHTNKNVDETAFRASLADAEMAAMGKQRHTESFFFGCSIPLLWGTWATQWSLNSASTKESAADVSSGLELQCTSLRHLSCFWF